MMPDEIATELPIVAHQQLLSDAAELEQKHVPGLLALIDTGFEECIRISYGQCNESIDAVRV